MTMIIAVPTGVKVFNWLLTMYRGRIEFHPSMMWSIGFMVTFVIGGMTGVLLAIPPADFLMHNTTFLVAHFHNMIIPGVLFGYLAGYMYWFPKAFGFAFHRGWGLGAFWCWFIGFYLAFMPLYPARPEGHAAPHGDLQRSDLAALPAGRRLGRGGRAVRHRLHGDAALRSIPIRDRARRATSPATRMTAAPWKWSTSSPPPPYNFA